jgi:hypothetical protein
VHSWHVVKGKAEVICQEIGWVCRRFPGWREREREGDREREREREMIREGWGGGGVFDSRAHQCITGMWSSGRLKLYVRKLGGSAGVSLGGTRAKT